MGILTDVIKKIKKRKEMNHKIGVNYFGREMIYSSSIIIHQHGNEIHIGKNRITGELGFVELATAIDLIVKEYMRVDCIETLTPSAMFNVPIKDDLDIAIREVLKKHNIIR